MIAHPCAHLFLKEPLHASVKKGQTHARICHSTDPCANPSYKRPHSTSDLKISVYGDNNDRLTMTDTGSNLESFLPKPSILMVSAARALSCLTRSDVDRRRHAEEWCEPIFGGSQGKAHLLQCEPQPCYSSANSALKAIASLTISIITTVLSSNLPAYLGSAFVQIILINGYCGFRFVVLLPPLHVSTRHLDLVASGESPYRNP